MLDGFVTFVELAELLDTEVLTNVLGIILEFPFVLEELATVIDVDCSAEMVSMSLVVR